MSKRAEMERKRKLVAKASRTMRAVEDDRIKRLENVTIGDPCHILSEEGYDAKHKDT